MFTGIVEELGSISEIEQKSANAIELTIGAQQVLSDIAIGDSISVNGICLTVTGFNKEYFTVDVMPETMKVTSLQSLIVGNHVNLERSIQAGGRFGGHFVTGHIDGTGTITRKEAVENAVYYDVKIAKEFSPYIVTKGSIAIDGVSLTIFAVNENKITISLIPHTMDVTVLGSKEVGDIVNIECDMLAKFIEHQTKLQKV